MYPLNLLHDKFKLLSLKLYEDKRKYRTRFTGCLFIISQTDMYPLLSDTYTYLDLALFPPNDIDAVQWSWCVIFIIDDDDIKLGKDSSLVFCLLKCIM